MALAVFRVPPLRLLADALATAPLATMIYVASGSGLWATAIMLAGLIARPIIGALGIARRNDEAQRVDPGG